MVALCSAIKVERLSLLSVKKIAEQLDTSVRSVYRMLADGLPYHDIPGGIKVHEQDLEAYLAGRKKCQSGRIERAGITLPSSEGESEFIESARRRQRGGRRRTRSLSFSTVSRLSNQERS